MKESGVNTERHGERLQFLVLLAPFWKEFSLLPSAPLVLLQNPLQTNPSLLSLFAPPPIPSFQPLGSFIFRCFYLLR